MNLSLTPIFSSYKVNTTTNHPELPFPEFSVLRRFNDFVWLHDQLNFSHPGAIVPPLPEKQTVGRFTPEFVECRRRALEKFMARITKHTVLKNSRCLNAFLQTDDSQFLQAKEQFRLEREKAAGSLTSWFENKVNSLTSSNSQAGLQKNAADLKFEEILQYITHLETQMSSVSKHTTTLVKHNRVMANALFEFGQAFTWLGQSEGDALGAALTQMGNTADQLSVLATENAEAEAILLDEPLEEFDRFKREKAEDIKLILLNYVNLQVTLCPLFLSSFVSLPDIYFALCMTSLGSIQ